MRSGASDGAATAIAIAGSSPVLSPPATSQPPLPTLRPFIDRTAGEFAHPAERDFAQILSYYRIRWSYEPTSFALAWTDDGRPAEMFTPDFYLPEQQLYIELTTMRQRLVTRKNRKLRRLRELYPNVRIKLLYQRDYRRLVECYRASTRAPRVLHVGRVLASAETIRARTAALAEQITCDAIAALAEADAAVSDKLLLLGVGRGSSRFMTLLAKELRKRGLPIERDRIELTRYRSSSGQRRVRVRQPPAAELEGRRVLVVEDIVSTGLSLKYLVAWLAKRGAAAIDVCALLDRAVARIVDVPLRYSGFEAPNDVLVGFGLNLRRQFRELPFIALVEPADEPAST